MNRSTRIFLIGLVLFLALGSAVLLGMIPHLVMGDMIHTHVDFDTVYAPEEYGLDAEEIVLTTVDGLNIAAYEVKVPNPKAVIVFISGIQNPSVTAFFGHARFFGEEGYASLLLEMRAHGKSEGDLIALGYHEHLDVKGAVDYIRSKDEYDGVPIVLYGVSMGGAVAINGAGLYPEIDGVVSMSAYSSWEDMFSDQMILSGAPLLITVLEKPFVRLYTMYKFGFQNRHISPKNQIKNLNQRPALIMHSKDDSQVPMANFQRIMEGAPNHVETWERSGDHHMLCLDYENPERDEEYVHRVLSFLNRHFPSHSL